MATYLLTEKAIVLKPEDDVAVARAPLSAGTVLEDGAARIEVRADIRPGHTTSGGPGSRSPRSRWPPIAAGRTPTRG